MNATTHLLGAFSNSPWNENNQLRELAAAALKLRLLFLPFTIRYVSEYIKLAGQSYADRDLRLKRSDSHNYTRNLKKERDKLTLETI